MSIYCSKQDCACSLIHPQKAEVRNGRRYINGRDVGPAQPEQHGQYTNASGTQPARRGRGRR